MILFKPAQPLPVHYRLEQRVLIGELEINCALGDTGLARDIVYAGFIKSPARKQRAGALEQSLAPIGLSE